MHLSSIDEDGVDKENTYREETWQAGEAFGNRELKSKSKSKSKIKNTLFSQYSYDTSMIHTFLGVKRVPIQ